MTNDERTKADVLDLMREATSRPGQSLAEAMWEAAAEIGRLRTALKRIAKDPSITCLAGNPTLWPSTVASDALKSGERQLA